MYYGKLINEKGEIISYQTSDTPFVYTDTFVPLDENSVADLIIQEYEQEQERLRQIITHDNKTALRVAPGQTIIINEEDIDPIINEEEQFNNEKI